MQQGSVKCIKAAILQTLLAVQSHKRFRKPFLSLKCVFRLSSLVASSEYSPIVDMKVVLKESSLNLNSRHVLPTPLSPMSNSLKR